MDDTHDRPDPRPTRSTACRRRAPEAAAAHPRRRHQGLLRRSAARRGARHARDSPASSTTSRRELVVTARAGTPLAEIEAALADEGPVPAVRAAALRPRRAPSAAWSPPGSAGPRAAASARVRDFVLGVQLLDGRGEVLQLRRPGDEERRRLRRVARCSVGALGTLGVHLRGVAQGAAAAAARGDAALRDGAGRRRSHAERLGRPAAAAQRAAPGGTACWSCGCPARAPAVEAARAEARRRGRRAGLAAIDSGPACANTRRRVLRGAEAAEAARCGACRCRRPRRRWRCRASSSSNGAAR